MESSSLIFSGSRSGRSTLVSALYVIGLTVGTVCVTAFVLFSVFRGWNAGVNSGRRHTPKALIGKGGHKAPVSPRYKGPYTPRWYPVLISGLNSTSAAGDGVTFIYRLMNDTSLPIDSAESDVAQPVASSVDEPWPHSSTTKESTETADVPVWTAAEDASFATESRDVTRSRENDVNSKANAEYTSREPFDGAQDDGDTSLRSQVVSSTVTAEEGDSDEDGGNEFQSETDAAEADIEDVTSVASARTEGTTESVSHGQTRVFSEQGTNYEPAEGDGVVRGGDGRPSNDQEGTEVTAPVTQGMSDEIHAEPDDDDDDDDSESPAMDVRDASDGEYSPTEAESNRESQITDAVPERGPDHVSSDLDGAGQGDSEHRVSDSENVATPERDEGVSEGSEHFSTDQGLPVNSFSEEVTDALPRAGDAGDAELPYRNEDVTDRGIDNSPADIENTARDSDDIRGDAYTGSIQVVTYRADDSTDSVPQDIQAHGGKEMTELYVAGKGATMHTHGSSQPEPYRNDAISGEQSSSTATAWVITYGPDEDVDTYSVNNDADGESVKITTQRKTFSDTPRTVTTKDNFEGAEFIHSGSEPYTQTQGKTTAESHFPYSSSEGNWNDVLADLENTVQVSDEGGTTDDTGRKIAPITRNKSEDGSEAVDSATKGTVQEDDFDKVAREAYSFTEDTSETEPLVRNSSILEDADNAPIKSYGINQADGTTYLSDDMDWSEVASMVPDKRDQRQMSVPANRARTRRIYAENGTVAQSLSTIVPTVVTSRMRPRANHPRTRLTAPVQTSTLTQLNGRRTQRHILGEHGGLVTVRGYTTRRQVPLQVAHRNVPAQGTFNSVGRNTSAASRGSDSTQPLTDTHGVVAKTSSKGGHHAESHRSKASLRKHVARFTLLSSSVSPQQPRSPDKSSHIINISRAAASATLRRLSHTTAVVHSEADKTERGTEHSATRTQPQGGNQNLASPLVKQQPFIEINADPLKANRTQRRDRKVSGSSATVRRNVTNRSVVEKRSFATTLLLPNFENSASRTSYVTPWRRELATAGQRRQLGVDASSLKDTATSTTYNVTERTKSKDNRRDNTA